MRNYRGNTLLVELVIVILFFTLSVSIVLQVFARAQTLNRDADVLNHALMQAENTAETLSVSTRPEDVLQSLGYARRENGFEAVADGYRISATVNRFTQPSGELITVALQGWQGDKLLFTLPAVRYLGGDAP